MGSTSRQVLGDAGILHGAIQLVRDTMQIGRTCWPHFCVDDAVLLPLAAELKCQLLQQSKSAAHNGQVGVEAIEDGKQADDVIPDLVSSSTSHRDTLFNLDFTCRSLATEFCYGCPGKLLGGRR